MRKLSGSLVLVAVLAVMTPVIASAHSNKDTNRDDSNRGNISVQSFGRLEGLFEDRNRGANKADDKHDKDDTRHDENRNGKFYSGTVASLGTNSFTLTTTKGESVIVNTTDAKIYRVGKPNFAFADMRTGDQVWVRGSTVNAVVSASVVYDLLANQWPALKGGTITAINGNTVTIETKKSGTVTVNTTSDTTVKSHGQTLTLADLQVGSKVKVFGLWDSMQNLLNAIKIKVK